MAAKANFAGYKWNELSDYTEDHPDKQYIQWLIDRIDGDALCQHASRIHGGKTCTLDPQITMGGRHIVRILNFEDGSRWIARLRMTDGEAEAESLLLQREVDSIQLVRERSSVPVPVVYGYDTTANNDIGAPFMLMECLAGNSAIEMNGSSSYIPLEHKHAFYKNMARFQIEISNITFSKIGAIIRLPDGSHDIGPLPGLGGPFNTATAYFKAWAKTARFASSISKLKEDYGDRGDEFATSVTDFPPRLEELAANISTRDHGPFPLYHSDFGHQNMVVDDCYNILGVIDWEHAYSVPWEAIDIPSVTLGICPASTMDLSEFDENMVPKDSFITERLAERKEYVNMVREVEREKGLSPLLSDVLEDEAGQDLATSLRRYAEGSPGLYCKVLDAHHERWSNPQAQVSTPLLPLA